MEAGRCAAGGLISLLRTSYGKVRNALRIRQIIPLAGLVTLLLALSAGLAAAQTPGAATAELEDTDGEPVGTASFVEGPEGVEITVDVQGIEPGEKGIHVHETGSIEPDFEAAGDHFNPTDAEHGLDNPEGAHAGDLPNITVEEDGTASYQTVNDMVTLGEGEESILGGDGTALVIHSDADDQVTDPDGDSGDRVAAGVVEPADDAALPETGGTALLPVAAALALAGAGILFARRFVRS